MRKDPRRDPGLAISFNPTPTVGKEKKANTGQDSWNKTRAEFRLGLGRGTGTYPGRDDRLAVRKSTDGPNFLC